MNTQKLIDIGIIALIPFVCLGLILLMTTPIGWWIMLREMEDYQL